MRRLRAGAVGVERLAENFDRAGGGVEQARQAADGGAFARAVGPEKAEHRALRDGQREVVHRHHRAVFLHQIGDANGVHDISLFLPPPPSTARAAGGTSVTAPRSEKTIEHQRQQRRNRSASHQWSRAKPGRAAMLRAPAVRTDRPVSAADDHDVADERQIVAQALVSSSPRRARQDAGPQAERREKTSSPVDAARHEHASLRASAGSGRKTQPRR